MVVTVNQKWLEGFILLLTGDNNQIFAQLVKKINKRTLTF